ncbi:hypothetical protein AAG906_029473 [Vitis piasezkii]
MALYHTMLESSIQSSCSYSISNVIKLELECYRVWDLWNCSGYQIWETCRFIAVSGERQRLASGVSDQADGLGFWYLLANRRRPAFFFTGVESAF